MAIDQMEAVANNPSQLKMAADQMKNMSEGELNQALKQSPLVSQSQQTSPSAATPTMNNVSKSQFQQATQQMSTMSPDQLKQQAAMLKSMPLDTLRRTNPQMANMTDEQIQMSITQLEQMAENPDMVKMAADSMKNMTEEQYNGMRNMMGGAAGGGTGAAGGGTNSAGNAANSNNATAAGGMANNMPTDPSKMMEALLSNPDQLNTIVKTMKQNPEMMKQMMASQMGGGKQSDAQTDKMAKAIDSFTQMDDVKLERYLKVANGVQRVAKPMLTTFGMVKQTLGISTKTLFIMINLMIFACLFGLVRWWKLRNGGDGMLVEDGDGMTSGSGEEPMPEMGSEF
eukprot:CAMPEP_0172303808 /NCGR_PEP_ID=MMETSP1058-20130122/5331_1 /TAXON_ID=83371 /ORGANISM="Detonula confervacea, Strain CCMP 353" /LENGTH=340 /DNA_ID=CAMNT_0013014805 /DNA_START=14 /DNA_END=1036 /DNA_ORIENTATION=+